MERRRVQPYKVIKPSGFVFRNPRQRTAWERAMGRFADRTSCGLEALALRRNSDGRRKGSVTDVARIVYDLIRAGETNPTKALNLTRMCDDLQKMVESHHQEVHARKGDAHLDLIRSIDARDLPPAARLTGWYVGPEDVYPIGGFEPGRSDAKPRAFGGTKPASKRRP
jgi:hypothetical protein